ncbi:hypothetical protein AB0B62_11370 [Micromonospora chalcea]|uniref:hypothetical protein n=1 Tax=Micromonospora chalcea TaxID=1874 RepID=UPI0033DD85F1
MNEGQWMWAAFGIIVTLIFVSGAVSAVNDTSNGWPVAILAFVLFVGGGAWAGNAMFDNYIAGAVGGVAIWALITWGVAELF